MSLQVEKLEKNMAKLTIEVSAANSSSISGSSFSLISCTVHLNTASFP